MRHKIEETFAPEIQQQINDLRRQRDELNSKSSEMQKQIDELFIKALNYDKYVNKYIRYDDEHNDIYYYMYVTNVKRTYDGVCFIGTKFTCGIDDGDDNVDIYFRGMTNVESAVSYMYMHCVSIIDKEEFDAVINDTNKIFIKANDSIANRSQNN